MSDSRRIVIVAPTPAPYRAFAFDQVQQALAERYCFHVLFMERSWADMQWQDDLPKVMTSEVLPRSRWAKLFARVGGLRRWNKGLQRRLKQLDPAAVILLGYDSVTLWTALLWARRHGRGVLFHSDSNILKDRNQPLTIKRRLKRLVVSWFLRRVDAFLTIGTANEEYFAYYGAAKEKFFRTNYAFDIAQTAVAAQQQRDAGKPLKRQLKIPHEKVVLYLGRFIERKGVMDLVAAFRQALPDLGDAALVFVGDGPLRQKLQDETADMAGRVFFTGFCQPRELGNYYGIADVLVLPSWQEPWAFVLLEALVARVPVIASDQVGAAMDFIIPGRTGETFAPRDRDALARLIIRLLSDTAAAQRIGQAGCDHYLAWTRQYDAPAMYQKALDTVLATRSGPGK